MKHFKEPFYSKLAEKGTYSQWMDKGGTTMEQRAAGMVDKILATHKPEPLPADIQAGIQKIVEREQAWINNRK
jgi:trimethylamine--corrinoid protein Co-methyltransferase